MPPFKIPWRLSVFDKRKHRAFGVCSLYMEVFATTVINELRAGNRWYYSFTCYECGKGAHGFVPCKGYINAQAREFCEQHRHGKELSELS
jgi:hypothetical protein